VNTIDRLGVSYYVEHLTSELERRAYEYFDRIDKLGGVIPAIEENFFQREIAEASYRYQSEVEQNQRVVVGVNRYQLDDGPEPELLRVHMTLVPRILDLRRESGAEDVLVVVGGTIPTEDADELRKQGVAEVFGPGAPTSDIVDFLKGAVPA